MNFTNSFISRTKHARQKNHDDEFITKLMFNNNYENNCYKGITSIKLATYSHFITLTSSSTGLTPFPRSRKSLNQPSTLSCTLHDAEFSLSDGLNSTSDPVSSSRIISIGKSSESWNIKSHKCKPFFFFKELTWCAQPSILDKMVVDRRQRHCVTGHTKTCMFSNHFGSQLDHSDFYWQINSTV